LTVTRKKNIRSQKDFAIVGFDDLPIAKLSTPELTTVRPLTNPIIMSIVSYSPSSQAKFMIIRAPKNFNIKKHSNQN